MNEHDALDARARAAHRDALAHLSPRIQAQLAQRRHAALAPTASHARPAFGWALATLAVCAIAIGVFRPAERTPAPARADGVAAVAAVPDTLEDNPDFYLWLASRDADSLASE